ncbi:MAG: four helix bundle protein [Candidatus Jorgensenbacteria bacterium]|nr:four helix bundle protein [Candidatus Jorgensenbacteria bacterium]
MPHIPKTSRYTLGAKIDLFFLEIIEYIFSAAFITRHERLMRINGAVTKLDLLKFFLQIAWEIKSLDTKKYIALSEKLDETGRMLGGWIKQLS